MKLISLSVSVALITFAGLAQADESGAPTALTATPQSTAEANTNPAAYPAIAANPAAFAQWSNAMMNPATYIEMMRLGMDPNSYARTAAQAMNPASLPGYQHWTDPAVYLQWLQAAMNPGFYTSMMAPALNPATYMNWATLPVNPQLWSQGMQMLNPALYMKWLTSPMSPPVLGAAMTPLNPGLYPNWAATAVNPANYGPWGSFLTQPGLPGGAVPFNPADLMKMLPVPQPAP
jgi:hypothetical protein